MKNLDDKKLDFLRLVAEAARANPFDDARDALDIKILKMMPRANNKVLSDAEAIAQETEKVLFDSIPAGGIRSLATNELGKQIIADAALFAVFHRYMGRFDDHIIKQNETLGSNLQLPFADQILNDLKILEVPEKPETIVGLFFQMRRAFFFISKNVTGQSEPVRKLRSRLWQSVFSHDLRFYLGSLHKQMESFSTLLIGATGVGKSQAAAALGRSAFIPFQSQTSCFSASFLDIYVTANIAEYPENLIESELFGHKKGSFTGALENYSGLLGQTHSHGVLFLDEIGELSAPVQVKLLRVLQERTYKPVGSHTHSRFSGRLISATNADLMSKIARGHFRSDLYYRLASDVIEIPSLRERLDSSPEESKRLVDRIVSRLVGLENESVSKKVHQAILESVPNTYAWPGNLREFEQCVRSILLHGTLKTRLDTLLPLPSTPAEENRTLFAWESLAWTADDMLAAYVRHAYEKLGSFERVAQRLNLDWRTVKKWATPTKKAIQGEQ